MCTPAQYAPLKAEKERACNQERRCVTAIKGVDCDEYRASIARNQECIQARNAVMMRCFKGGDGRHRIERKNAVDVLNFCRKQLGKATVRGWCRR
jgi:hypothetical protein